MYAFPLDQTLEPHFIKDWKSSARLSHFYLQCIFISVCSTLSFSSVAAVVIVTFCSHRVLTETRWCDICWGVFFPLHWLSHKGCKYSAAGEQHFWFTFIHWPARTHHGTEDLFLQLSEHCHGNTLRYQRDTRECLKAIKVNSSSFFVCLFDFCLTMYGNMIQDIQYVLLLYCYNLELVESTWYIP